MKIIAAIFLTVAVSILLFGGIAAVQYQSDIGDTIVDNESVSYDQYNELKNTSAMTFSFLSYSPYLLMLYLMMIFGAFMIGAIVLIRIKM